MKSKAPVTDQATVLNSVPRGSGFRNIYDKCGKLPFAVVRNRIALIDSFPTFKKLLFDGFNTACKNIAASFLKVGDESMSAIRFRTTAKGNLPHLSYIFRKPEPLGTKFKTVVCSVTGALLFIKVQRGKEGMKDSRYQ